MIFKQSRNCFETSLKKIYKHCFLLNSPLKQSSGNSDTANVDHHRTSTLLGPMLLIEEFLF